MRSYPLFILAFIFMATTASSQLKLPINNAFRSDIQKVVEAFPHQFSPIRGDVIMENPQTVEYASTVKPGGAQEAMVVKYSSLLKPVYSWQAVMLATEDYEEAVKKYKWLFNQLKGMNVKYVADLYTLRGIYETPDESRKFTTSILTPANPPMALKKLKVEVSMQFEFPEWKVLVLVYEKEREDTDQYSESK